MNSKEFNILKERYFSNIYKMKSSMIERLIYHINNNNVEIKYYDNNEKIVLNKNNIKKYIPLNPYTIRLNNKNREVIEKIDPKLKNKYNNFLDKSINIMSNYKKFIIAKLLLKIYKQNIKCYNNNKKISLTYAFDNYIDNNKINILYENKEAVQNIIKNIDLENIYIYEIIEYIYLAENNSQKFYDHLFSLMNSYKIKSITVNDDIVDARNLNEYKDIIKDDNISIANKYIKKYFIGDTLKYYRKHIQKLDKSKYHFEFESNNISYLTIVSFHARTQFLYRFIKYYESSFSSLDFKRKYNYMYEDLRRIRRLVFQRDRTKLSSNDIIKNEDSINSYILHFISNSEKLSELNMSNKQKKSYKRRDKKRGENTAKFLHDYLPFLFIYRGESVITFELYSGGKRGNQYQELMH